MPRHSASRCETLTRKLEEEVRTFRAIRDDLHRDLAVQLLTQSRATVDSIATLVGFANTAAFSRVFIQDVDG